MEGPRKVPGVPEKSDLRGVAFLGRSCRAGGVRGCTETDRMEALVAPSSCVAQEWTWSTLVGRRFAWSMAT